MEKEKVQADIIGDGYKKPSGKPARTDNRRQKAEKRGGINDTVN